MAAKWVLSAAMLALAACSPVGNDVLLGGGVGHEQLQPPDKFLSDRLADSITGLDCNFATMSVRGSYCTDPAAPKPPAPPTVTCYPSLGTVDCVSAIDPNRNGVAPITYPTGSSPATLVQPTRAGAVTMPYAMPQPNAPLNLGP